MTVAAVPARRTFPARLVALCRTMLLGTLLSLAAPSSVVALGWLMRHMRHVARRQAGLSSDPPGWILGPPGAGWPSRLLGGFAANVRVGLQGAIALALGTLPFTGIWILSWWAGWENSFGKGYELAFIGPLLGLSGVVLFCLIMIWLPIAFAHQAVEDRALALFEWRMVHSAVRHNGWAYVALALATVLLALPVFAGRGLAAFAEGIHPGLADLAPSEIDELRNRIALAKAAYVFAALLVLRSWAARLYATAVARARNGLDAALWAASALDGGASGGSRPWRLSSWLRLAILPVIWLGLAAQIFVGQFLNHDWHAWLTHPFFLLPWPI